MAATAAMATPPYHVISPQTPLNLLAIVAAMAV
jgi:hypothetical protein